jgi:hypothetical protein
LPSLPLLWAICETAWHFWVPKLFFPLKQVISQVLHYRSCWSFIFTIIELERGLRNPTFPSSSKSSISNKNPFDSYLFHLLS